MACSEQSVSETFCLTRRRGRGAWSFNPKIKPRLTLLFRDNHDYWLLLEAIGTVSVGLGRSPLLPSFTAGVTGIRCRVAVTNRHLGKPLPCSNRETQTVDNQSRPTVIDGTSRRCRGLPVRLCPCVHDCLCREGNNYWGSMDKGYIEASQHNPPELATIGGGLRFEAAVAKRCSQRSDLALQQLFGTSELGCTTTCPTRCRRQSARRDPCLEGAICLATMEPTRHHLRHLGACEFRCVRCPSA